ncbi:DMT family transporter [Gemmobacter serpentinus]|uniref:DMT family transporter n=1 Tax=Gemmobacter serpentinus TaxID=2652247 RepID=UPI00124DABF7|nr:DMT family transporter [Gemmobacter serpentinus]
MSDNLRGSLFMVLAMLGFAIEDMALKRVAGAGMPVGEILIFFGGGGALLFAVLTRMQGQPIWHPAVISPRMLVKAAFEVMGRLFYTLAIALTALSSASAILQATPLVVVAGAALIFGEKVGWRRWSAILLGLAGVLIILRPGLDGFTPASLLAVLGLLGFAGRDLATRAAPRVLSNFQLGIYGFLAMVPTGAGLLIWQGGAVWPDAAMAAQLTGAVVVGVMAYWALTVAMRSGEVSVVTPFRYTRLVFALILGVLVFGERPDAATLIGSAIVVAAGIYTLLRSRRAA